MTEETRAQEAKASDSLYTWWFDVLAALSGARAARSKDERNGAAQGPSSLFPAGQVSQALKLTQDLLEAIYGGYFRALVAGQPGGELHAFEKLLQDSVAGLGKQVAGLGEGFSGEREFGRLMPGLADAAMAPIARALRPLSTNMERAYGGLADAIGLEPLRELQAAGRDMAVAALAQRGAQAEYLQIALDAAGKGLQTLMSRLVEMGEGGESVDTMLALVRLWARTMDEAMHDAMQSPRALQATAKLIRASASSRQQQQRIVAIASEALNVPTRAEVDDAYREIQELKRELRRLRKGVPLDSPTPAATPARKASSPRKKTKGAVVT